LYYRALLGHTLLAQGKFDEAEATFLDIVSAVEAPGGAPESVVFQHNIPDHLIAIYRARGETTEVERWESFCTAPDKWRALRDTERPSAAHK
jgi:hypothetical protein